VHFWLLFITITQAFSLSYVILFTGRVNHAIFYIFDFACHIEIEHQCSAIIFFLSSRWLNLYRSVNPHEYLDSVVNRGRVRVLFSVRASILLSQRKQCHYKQLYFFVITHYSRNHHIFRTAVKVYFMSDRSQNLKNLIKESQIKTVLQFITVWRGINEKSLCYF
jgi:hypothetical protein